MKIRVAGAQIAITSNVESNVAAINQAIDFAHDEKADILLTPEGALSGYTRDFDMAVITDVLARVIAKAKENHVGLALGTCFVEPVEKECFNQIRFYHPDGKYLGFHSKILTCGSLVDPSQGETNYYASCPLRAFQFKDITIGGLICNDLWANPECTPAHDSHLTQQLSGMGAKIIFHAVNGGRNGNEWSNLLWNYHEANLRIRARSGHVWIVTVDNCQPTHLPCSAPSGVINPEGDWACQTESRGKQFFAYTIDL